MPRKLLPLLQALAVNAIPAYGFWKLGWSPATAVALFWLENFLGSLLIALRMVLHRRLTHKKGYERGQFGATYTVNDEERTYPSFLSEFLSTSIAFNLTHGIFLAAVLFLMLPRSYPGSGVDFVALKRGFLAVAAILATGFAFDCVGLSQRPFVWIKNLAQRSLGRTILIHLTIIFGMLALAKFEKPAGFFGVFLGFKLLFDLGGSRNAEVPKEPPRWASTFANKLKPGNFEDYYRKAVANEERAAVEDERVKPAAAGRNRKRRS
jgi:hypothetical protein